MALRLLPSQSSSQRLLTLFRSRPFATVTKPQGRLVILGSGWGAFSALRDVDTKRYEVVVISPRNHFVFTPLLASSAVGTIEHRCVTEPIRGVRRDSEFVQAECQSVDFDKKMLNCKWAFGNRSSEFTLNYDKLVIAVGAASNTFGISGVKEHANFLKETVHARQIRRKIIDAFEMANEPGTSEEEIDRLLHFVVVGGGPTGVEFAGELYDFIHDDLSTLYPDFKNRVRITLVEATDKILTGFDTSLAEYAQKKFRRSGIELLKGAPVKEVTANKLTIAGGKEVPFGVLVWSTGIAPIPFIKQLDCLKDRSGKILVNQSLQALDQRTKQPIDGVFAIGDCSSIQDGPLPATAQVASQQGYYIAKKLSALAQTGELPSDPFVYRHLASMAYLGGWDALVDSKRDNKTEITVQGRLAWLIWRSAYFTKTVSWKNKVLIPVYWFLTFLLGRDISRL